MIARLKEWFAGFSDPHDVRIFRDRIVLRNTRTGRSIDRCAAKRFSSDRKLVADPDAATALLGEMIREMERARRFAMWPRASIHLMEPGYGAPSESEARTICETFETLGYQKVEIVRG